MEKEVLIAKVGSVFNKPTTFLRKLMFGVLRAGPIPNHIAFIMDGNRRYAKKNQQLQDGDDQAGHDAGFWALMLMLYYCFELGVKYVTAYAFSIDNFNRKPEEVERLMDSMVQKIDVLTTIVNRLKVRVHFAGNLQLLRRDVREAAKGVMEESFGYSKYVLTICVAYTSTDEVLHAVQEWCQENVQDQHYYCCNDDDDDEKVCSVKLREIEKHMYMAIAPEPEIVIRTGGEKRLSNFLLWQTTCAHLCAMFVLWPEIGFGHLAWAVLNFQRNYPYFQMKKKAIPYSD